ncbi:coil containing protein [Vibrio phage 1.021.C._10N.222.51.F9]|nr:coil containing protein [Vibrio phage 1.021.A._10N.222.51.F9]AUR82162.1 coil containing protein [Vibrio phage 1.021.B._10N.222.51.F9]AUR82212.1 coil containing protein [Vibrio phage 1.021.C._10N.222.51.F9]
MKPLVIKSVISLPVRTIHKDEEIVDAMGDLLLVAADDSVDMKTVAQALNNYDNVVDEVKQLREKLKQIESDASFYFSCASDKATMKYGLSKVRKLAQQ